MIGVPLTVMVSPAAKSAASEFVAAAPDNSVAPVIGAGTAALLLTTPPAIVADELKKLSDALIADAATSEVSASFFTDEVSAACKFTVVAAVSTPIWKVPAAGGVVVVVSAVSSIDFVVPSGRWKLNFTFSPLFGLTAPRSTVAAGGAPAGWASVAPVNVELTEASLRPNAEPSSARLVTVVVSGGDVTARRPSAEARSQIGLLAFIDHLLQTGLGSDTVKHIIGWHRCGRIGCASGKQITVAGLGVEHGNGVGERGLRRDLAGGLAVVVEHDSRRSGRALD